MSQIPSVPHSIIEPTVGRVVHYIPEISATEPLGPYAAIITKVHTARMVNLAIFRPEGPGFSRTSVQLMQAGDPAPPPGGAFCQWMAYQQGQAAKTEAAEKALAESRQWTPQQLKEIEAQGHPAMAVPTLKPLLADLAPGDDVFVTLAQMQDRATVLTIDRNDNTVRVAWWHDGNIREALLPRCVVRRVSGA